MTKLQGNIHEMFIEIHTKSMRNDGMHCISNEGNERRNNKLRIGSLDDLQRNCKRYIGIV